MRLVSGRDRSPTGVRRVFASTLAIVLALAGGCAGPGASGGSAAAEAEPDEPVPDLHDRPIVEREGRTLLWASESEAGDVEWFDMTGSPLDPQRFQFGIGKDVIASIDRPEFVAPDDPRLAARGVTPETEVLGVSLEGVARAYPVNVMSRHEVVNDEFAGRPYAVLW